MKGYKFTTEQEAKEAQQKCNDFYGIPKNTEEVTKNWVSINETADFWYMIFNDTLLPILGEPSEIEINDEP